MPLIFFALPGTAASLVLATLGLAKRSRTLLLLAAMCSVPMLLYVLMGNAWWQLAVVPILGLYFYAGFLTQRNRALAFLAVLPYFIFVAMLVGAIWFQRPDPTRGRVGWTAQGVERR